MGLGRWTHMGFLSPGANLAEQQIVGCDLEWGSCGDDSKESTGGDVIMTLWNHQGEL